MLGQTKHVCRPASAQAPCRPVVVEIALGEKQKRHPMTKIGRGKGWRWACLPSLGALAFQDGRSWRSQEGRRAAGLSQTPEGQPLASWAWGTRSPLLVCLRFGSGRAANQPVRLTQVGGLPQEQGPWGKPRAGSGDRAVPQSQSHLLHSLSALGSPLLTSCL